ncbi:MAG: hypothetical protein ACK4MQ_07510 [Hyphomonas sp.]
MSNDAERALIDLVAREQRSFRGILFAGISALLLVMALSVTLAVVFYNSAKSLNEESERLSRNAFDSRRQLDQQVNRVAGLEAYTRSTYEEIRSLLGSDTQGIDCGAALPIAATYLQQGAISLADERVLEHCSSGQAANDLPPGRLAILNGAIGLRAWERSRDAVPKEGDGRPDELAKAHAQFLMARDDPSLTHLASNGLAWVEFIMAGSERYNFAEKQCFDVIVLGQQSTVSASSTDIALQPLYWIGQCSRKMARSLDALEAYGNALVRIKEVEAQDSGRQGNTDAELLIKMNAYHGLGTVLISTLNDADDARLTEARQLADRVCKPVAGAGRTPLELADACLDEAIEIRRSKLRQTRNQISGSRENLTFIHLRAGDTKQAYETAKDIETTGLFAWNELMRVLTAEKFLEEIKASRSDESKDQREKTNTLIKELESTAGIARRNVSHFRIDQFNLCEIQVLLSEGDFEQARQIIFDEHKRKSKDLKLDDVACRRAGAN